MPVMTGDGDAAGVLMLIEGESPGMGMPLMLPIGDGDAAAIDMPLIPLRRAARTWSGVYPVPSIQSSRTTVQSWS
jgi:hypothetical protein